MFTPPEISHIEPLLDMDADLAELEQQASSTPLTAEQVEFLANEYFNRAYMQRALHASQRLVELAPTKAAAWRTLANCQLDLAQDEEAKSSIDIMLNQGDKTTEDVAWAQARLTEISARTSGQAPSLADATLATLSPPEAAALAPTPAPAPPPAPAPLNLSAPVNAPAPAQPADRIPSALDMMAAPAPAPQPKKGLTGALEQQGIITVVASKDNEQLKEVKKLLDADPDNQDLLDWYAFACYTADQVDEAIRVYERLIKESEPTDKTLYYLGSAYLKKPDIRTAFKYFGALKKKFPNSSLIEKIDEKKAKLANLTK